jgi:hypothetical protein
LRRIPVARVIASQSKQLLGMSEKVAGIGGILPKRRSHSLRMMIREFKRAGRISLLRMVVKG